MTALINKIKDNTENLIRSIDSLVEENVSRQYQDSWSILEILEHIYLTDKSIFYVISQTSDRISENTEIVGKSKLEHILVANRKSKIQSPNILIPKGEFQNLKEARQTILDFRNHMINQLETGEITLNNRVYKHFILGEMTVSDWLYFVIYHTDRHLQQIEDKL